MGSEMCIRDSIEAARALERINKTVTSLMSVDEVPSMLPGKRGR